MKVLKIIWLFSFLMLRRNISNIVKKFKIFEYSYKNRCQIELDGNFTGSFNRLFIGEGTTINSNANFRFGQGIITIGKNCLLARNVTIITQTYEVDANKIILPSKMYVKNVFIEDNVWIGGNVVIMPGVCISKGSVIGAGSIVTKDVNEYEIWAGSPAKLIRKRNIQND